MENYLDDLGKFPCSFSYDGKKYKGFEISFEEIGREAKTKEGASHTLINLLHTDSNVIFTLDVREYPAYNAYEWTISLMNASGADTGVFSDFNAADIYFCGNAPVLKGLSGDAPNWYLPYETDLIKESKKNDSQNGRPTHGAFPYYNLEYGDGGIFVAIGWPGCWKAEFNYSPDTNSTHFSGGLGGFSSYLKPAEQVRMPLMAFVEYNGRDEQKAMNLWRKWFIERNMRKIGGKPFAPSFAASKMADASTSGSLLDIIRLYDRNGIKLDYFWLDAGWYSDAEGNTVEWPQTGTLMIDSKRYPDKFKGISDYLHSIGSKLLLWFEPEVIRLNREQFLANITDFKEEWMLGRAMKGTWLEGELVDLGNPECVKWLLGRICKIIDEGGISLYRQDFNVDPGDVWRKNDAADRNGMTENKYCTGYLAFWDALIARYPDMMIDSCASGGGRNDLETLRRSVPLHITDLYDGGNDNRYTMKNSIIQTFCRWIPYFDCELYSSPTLYKLRSNYAPFFMMSPEDLKDKDFLWDLVKKSQGEWNRIKKYFLADYYQVVPWNKSETEWKGWEFIDPAHNEGYVQLMRPAGCELGEQTIKLYGLDPDCVYALQDFDGLIDQKAKGKELMEKGIKVTLPNPEYAMIIVFGINPD